MKRLLQVMSLCLAIAVLPGFAQASSVSTLTGSVLLDGHVASAVVVAVPYNTQTHQTIEGKAVVVPTDATGRFQLTVPSKNFLLVAWDGHNGVVVDSPTGSVKLNMTDQAPLSFQVAADCGWKCACSHIVGNLYWVTLWSNSVACGSYQYLSWGCRC